MTKKNKWIKYLLHGTGTIVGVGLVYISLFIINSTRHTPNSQIDEVTIVLDFFVFIVGVCLLFIGAYFIVESLMFKRWIENRVVDIYLFLEENW